MRTDAQIKLLELTRHQDTLAIDELAQEMRIPQARLMGSLENFRRNGYICFGRGRLAVNSKQRILIAEKLIHCGRDPDKIARCLEWQEFESFASHSLTENGFQAVRHFVFKTRVGRREIDVLAWNDNFLFAIDCKHWTKGFQPSRMKTAVLAHIERTSKLAERPDILRRIGLRNPDRRSIMPVFVTLGEPRLRSIDGVPIVAVSKLLSFLYGISPIDENFLRIRVRHLDTSRLLAEPPKS